MKVTQNEIYVFVPKSRKFPLFPFNLFWNSDLILVVTSPHEEGLVYPQLVFCFRQLIFSQDLSLVDGYFPQHKEIILLKINQLFSMFQSLLYFVSDITIGGSKGLNAKEVVNLFSILCSFQKSMAKVMG